MLDAEQRLRALHRERLDAVDDRVSLVVAPRRVALGVLVREHGPGRGEHGGRDVVLGRDQAERVVLARLLGGDQFGDARRRRLQGRWAWAPPNGRIRCPGARRSGARRFPVVTSTRGASHGAPSEPENSAILPWQYGNPADGSAPRGVRSLAAVDLLPERTPHADLHHRARDPRRGPADRRRAARDHRHVQRRRRPTWSARTRGATATSRATRSTASTRPRTPRTSSSTPAAAASRRTSSPRSRRCSTAPARATLPV